ncbi:MAG TPA: DUF4861 domain-containing protein [Petrimonas sp.]|nr:DUF4861 domain-containing protein [Petrimonas sp.]
MQTRFFILLLSTAILTGCGLLSPRPRRGTGFLQGGKDTRPGNEANGTIYTAAFQPNGYGDIRVSNGHYMGLNSYQPGTPYTYYAGGGWSKAGFDSFEGWTKFVKEEKEKIDQPLIIQIL